MPMQVPVSPLSAASAHVPVLEPQPAPTPSTAAAASAAVASGTPAGRSAAAAVAGWRACWTRMLAAELLPASLPPLPWRGGAGAGGMVGLLRRWQVLDVALRLRVTAAPDSDGVADAPESGGVKGAEVGGHGGASLKSTRRWLRARPSLPRAAAVRHQPPSESDNESQPMLQCSSSHTGI